MLIFTPFATMVKYDDDHNDDGNDDDRTAEYTRGEQEDLLFSFSLSGR